MTTIIRQSPSGPTTDFDSSDIANISSVPGETVTQALDNLAGSIDVITTDTVDNLSTVPGATATAALDALATLIATLGSSQVANASGISGATVTAALDALGALIGALTPVPLSALAPQAGNTFVANASAVLASPTAIAIGTNSVIGRVGGNIVSGPVVTSQIGGNQVSNPRLAMMPATSVKANPSGSLADADDLSAASDDTLLRRVGGALGFGQLTAGMFSAGLVQLGSITAIASNSVLGNPTAGLASPAALSVGTNTVVGRVGGNLLAAQLVTAQVALNQITNALLAQMGGNTLKANATGTAADAQDLTVGPNTVVGRAGGNMVAAQIVTAQMALSQVTNAVLAQMASNTVKVNATASLADAQDLAIGTNTVLGRVGGNIVAAQLVASQIGANQVGNPLLAQMLANTVKVNATAATADPQDVAIGANTVLGRVAGNIVAAQIVTSQIGANQVTNPVLAQMAALTVKANPTGALANAADLAASSDDTVLRRVAGALGFGALTAAMFPAAVIPLTSLAAQAANTIVANATAGSASPTAVAIGTNSVLGRVAGNIVAAQLVTAQIAASQVTNALLAQMAANTVKVNATGALADAQDLAIGTNTVLGRVAGTIVAAQIVTAQIANGQVTNALLANMAPGTMKGQTVDGATGAPVDLTGLEQAENWRRETVQTVSGVAGTLDIALNDDTTLLLIRTTADATLRTLGTTAINPGGREVMIEHDRLSGTGILTIAHNTVGTFTSFFCPNALSIAVGQTTCLEARLRNGFWRPQGTAGQIVTASITDANVTLPKLATQAANTIVANDTAGVASPTAVAIGTNTVLGRVGGNIVAAQLVASQIGANQIGNPLLAQMLANTVKVNATAATADPQDVAIGANTVLGRVAGNIVAAQVVTSQIGANQVTNPVLAQMAALTVKANPTGALANAADLAASSDDTVLRRVAGALSFGTLTAGMFPAAVIPLASLAAQAANTIVANATAGSASPTAVAIGTNSVLGRVAGNIVAAQLVTAQIAASQVTNALLAQMAANTVKVNATAALADAQDVAIGTNSVLGRVAGNIVAAQLVTAQIAVNQVTNPLLAQMLANTVKVNATAVTADPQDVAIGTNSVLGRVAGNIVAAQIVTSQIGASQITNALLANMAPGTMKGQTVDGATGAPVDLTGLEQAENWRRETVQTVSGVAGTLDIALNDDTTLLLIRTTADATLRTLGTTAINPGGREVMIEHDRLSGTGTLTIAHNTAGTFTPFFCPNALSIAMGQTTCLEARLRSGFWRPQGTAGQIVTASITDANVTLPKLAVQAANTIVANATAGSASPTAVAIGTNSVLGRVAGNIVAAQLVNSQMVGGATATLKGVAINGIAGTLTDITLTQLGDMFRLVSGVTDVLAPATIDDYAVAETTKLLRININADGDLNITGFALGTNNGGGWFRLFNQSTSVVRRIVLKNATGSSLGNQIITPDGLDFVLDRFGDAVDLQAIGGRWQVVQLSKAMQANSVRVNASSATANAQNLAIGTNSVLGRVAGNIVAAQLVTGQLADANVTYAKIQNVQALSILARTVNSAGVVQELHSPGSFAVPYDDGAGNLVFATLVTGNYGNASVTLPKLATQAANTIVANDTAGVASPNAVAIGTNSVLGRVAGNIVAAQLVNAQMANMADGTVKGRARGAGAGVPTDLTQTQAAAVAAPSIAQSIGYTAAAPIALTTLAAGHPAGLYLVSADAIVRTAGSTGTLARTASYNAPTLGAATTGAFPGGSITGTGRIPNSAALGASSILIPYTVRSDGTADIVTTFTPTGVSGSPVIDLYTSAALIGL